MRLKLTFSVLTLFFVCSIAFIPQMILSRVTRVNIATSINQAYQDTVYCGGEIIEKNTREIYLESPVIANDVRVAVGDRVWRGQTLATVDTRLTQSVLEQGTPTATKADLAPVPEEISALARRYGIADDAVQAAVGQYGGVTVEAAPSTERPIPSQIIAPINGIVTAVNLKTDVLTPTSRPVITVSDDSSYAVLVSVNEADIAKLQLGDLAHITGVGFGGQSYTGSVTRIYPVARKMLSGVAQQTVVDVELSIDENGGEIKPGFSAKAVIFTQDCGEMLTVPYEAVGQDTDNREYVYVYSGNRVQKRFVTVGRELTEAQEILNGLSCGEQIVLEPGRVRDEDELFLPVQRGNAP